MTFLTRVGVILVAGAVTTAPAHGQSTTPPRDSQRRATPRPANVPGRLLPPPGMCRVWLDNVPARQQPAPTDCARAIRNRPPNGRVLFSEQQRGPQRRSEADRPEPRRADARRDTNAQRERPPTRTRPPAKPRTKPPNSDPPPA